MYVPVVAPLDPSLRDAEWLARIAGPAEQGDLAAVAELIPDDVLDRLAFAGSPADVARQVEDLARAGVTRVEFGTPHGLDALEGIRLLGEQVLPSFRRPGMTDTFELFDLRVTIEDIRGRCTCDHVVGDWFEVQGGKLSLPRGGAFACMRCNPRCHCCPPSSGRSRPTTG